MSFTDAQNLFKTIEPELKHYNWVSNSVLKPSNPWLQYGQHHGKQPLSFLVSKGRLKAVESILDFHQKTNMDVGLEQAWFELVHPFHAKPFVDLFLKLNIPLNLVQPQDEQTLLIKSIFYSNEETITALLEHGADPNFKPPKGPFSPLDALLKVNCSLSVFHLFLEKGLNLFHLEEEYAHKNPVEYFCFKDVEFTKLLLKFGLNPNFSTKPIFNHLERYPLLFQIIRQNIAEQNSKKIRSFSKIVDALIEAGADVNVHISGKHLGEYNRKMEHPFTSIEYLYQKFLLNQTLSSASNPTKPNSSRI